MSSSNEPGAQRVARSFLFVPGDRPERFSKAAASGAHSVILDLEDAVAPAAKAQARTAVAAWLADGARPVVRINAADTEWFEKDVDMIRKAAAATVMLPKAEADSMARVARLLPGREVIALVESVAGFMQLRQVSSTPGLVRIAFGSVDFAGDSGIADEAEAMTAIRTQIVLESCLSRLSPPIDGVSVEFNKVDQMHMDALRSRQLGFGGKLCIHPRQVAPVNTAFLPTGVEVAWAQRVVAVFQESNGAATSLEGKMIDKPVVDRARRILAEQQSGASA